MIPFDIAGSVHLPLTIHSRRAMVKAVANRLCSLLDEKGCVEVYLEGERVRFRNTMFGNFSFSDNDRSFLSGFGSGTFDIEAGLDGLDIRYCLPLAQMWLGLALLATVYYFFIAHAPANIWSAFWPLPLLPVAGFFVAFYFYIRARIWFMLRHGLKDVSETSLKP